MGDLLEQATTFLACPKDKSKLNITLDRTDGTIGRYICQSCGKEYAIVDGVPKFYDDGVQLRTYSEQELIKLIRGNLTGGDPISGYVDSLSRLYLQEYDKRYAMIRLIGILGEIGRGLPESDIARLQQEGTRARYDMELDYRGTLLLPKQLFQEIPNGLILETACGPGDNLIYLRREGLENPMVGLDISFSMVNRLRKQSDRESLGILSIQTDASKLPLQNNVATVVMQFNAFDRIAMLRKMAEETGRVLREDGVIIYGACEPPQYEYDRDGTRIVYVPSDQRITPEEAIRIAGRQTVFTQDFPWDVTTLLDGEEKLTTRVYLGKK